MVVVRAHGGKKLEGQLGVGRPVDRPVPPLLHRKTVGAEQRRGARPGGRRGLNYKCQERIPRNGKYNWRFVRDEYPVMMAKYCPEPYDVQFAFEPLQGDV